MAKAAAVEGFRSGEGGGGGELAAAMEKGGGGGESLGEGADRGFWESFERGTRGK